jgi:DNA polymerase III delta prime subunit
MIKKSIQEIEQTAISEIALQIGEFVELFAANIVGSKTGALDAIEEDWSRLRMSTEKVYQQMVSELTSSIDERDMIAKKKRSGTTEE